MRRKAGALVPLELSILDTGIELAVRGRPYFHGFLIAKEIKEREDARLLTAHGTLYKALDRMQKAGLLESEWEDPEHRRRRRTSSATALPGDRCRRSRTGNRARTRATGRDAEAALRTDHVVNTALALSVGMARSWVALYTVRLPLDIKEARRSEIDSDLWEQQWLASHRGDPAFGTAIEVLARMLRGIISDITWRVQASAPARPDRGIQMKIEALSMRGIGAIGVVLALFLVATGGAVTAVLIMIPIGIALAAIAIFRTRRPGTAVEIGDDRMGTEGKSRWKLLLVVMGASVTAVVAMAAYAFSLEEWGNARAMIFNLGGLIALGAFSTALVLLISDLIGRLRRKTDS